MCVQLPTIKHASLSLTSKIIFKSVTALQSLKTGDIIAGKIVDLFSQNSYVVCLGGQEIVAQSHIALTQKKSTPYRYFQQRPSFYKGEKFTSWAFAQTANLSQILKAFHLPASALTRQIVTQMLSLDIPISHNNISSKAIW